MGSNPIGRTCIIRKSANTVEFNASADALALKRYAVYPVTVRTKMYGWNDNIPPRGNMLGPGPMLGPGLIFFVIVLGLLFMACAT